MSESNGKKLIPKEDNKEEAAKKYEFDIHIRNQFEEIKETLNSMIYMAEEHGLKVDIDIHYFQRFGYDLESKNVSFKVWRKI